MPTGKQIRAARVLLDWDAEDLAQRVGMSRVSIQNIERGEAIPKQGTIVKLVKAFSEAGVEFTDNEGIRRRPSGIEIFEGKERLDDFYDFLYERLKEHGGDVCLSVGDQNSLIKHRKNPQIHYDRMKELFSNGTIKSFKIMATKSAYFNNPMFAEFKVYPETDISPTAFWAFGNCLALISFVHNPSPYIVVLLNTPLADAYRKSFDIAWRNAQSPSPDMEENNGE